jgi:hypothetical protein
LTFGTSIVVEADLVVSATGLAVTPNVPPTPGANHVVVGPVAGETVAARLPDVQFARLSLVPVIVARMTVELPAVTTELSGAMEMVTAGTVIVQLADFVVSALLVAVT